MPKEFYARFVRSPHSIIDLRSATTVGEVHRFKITSVLVLKQDYYESFIENLNANLPFLQRGLLSQVENGIWYCLFITHDAASDGVLVIMDGAYIGHAAYLSYTGRLKTLLSLCNAPDHLYSQTKLEAMPTDKLNAIVDDYMQLDYTSEAHTEYILQVLEIIEQRENKMSDEDIQESWEAFKKKFPHFFDIPNDT